LAYISIYFLIVFLNFCKWLVLTDWSICVSQSFGLIRVVSHSQKCSWQLNLWQQHHFCPPGALLSELIARRHRPTQNGSKHPMGQVSWAIEQTKPLWHKGTHRRKMRTGCGQRGAHLIRCFVGSAWPTETIKAPCVCGCCPCQTKWCQMAKMHRKQKVNEKTFQTSRGLRQK